MDVCKTFKFKNTLAITAGLRKLAVQWLNEVQFFNQTFVEVESFVLRNRQLFKPAKRYRASLKTSRLK